MSVGLSERQAAGGAVARVGFEYQDAYVLQHLPRWIAQGAFSHVVSEAVGDVEVCYVRPGGPFARVFYEMKSNTLSASEFWDEVARFRDVYAASPGEYGRFRLVCHEFLKALKPLFAKLDRLRGVGASYPPDSPIITNTRADIVAWATKQGQAADIAEFVMSHVEFETYSGQSADAVFVGEVANSLGVVDLTATQVNAFRDRCKDLIAQSSTRPVHRREVEAVLVAVGGDKGARWLGEPTRVLLTLIPVSFEELGLDVGPFSGDDRSQRTEGQWKAFFDDVARVSTFIKESRARRGVVLNAKQRMSAACMLGYVFSATRGFFLHIEHNGCIFRTDVHQRAEGSFFVETVAQGGVATREGVVCIGFPTAVGADVAVGEGTALNAFPRLTLESAKVIDVEAALNLAVAEAKDAMVRFRTAHGLTSVHIFIKAPSAFAMALGHRLNGIGAMQLYDWSDGGYVRTIRIGPD